MIRIGFVGLRSIITGQYDTGQHIICFSVKPLYFSRLGMKPLSLASSVILIPESPANSKAIANGVGFRVWGFRGSGFRV